METSCKQRQQNKIFAQLFPGSIVTSVFGDFTFYNRGREITEKIDLILPPPPLLQRTSTSVPKGERMPPLFVHWCLLFTGHLPPTPVSRRNLSTDICSCISSLKESIFLFYPQGWQPAVEVIHTLAFKEVFDSYSIQVRFLLRFVISYSTT